MYGQNKTRGNKGDAAYLFNELRPLYLRTSKKVRKKRLN